ncbi:MAG: energy-dependent translational throttle protein EttA [Lentisphaerae bacterium RIFOXYB12_FULL_65_16]|nr:MAG: energy-dependent translational throttle protein EttA [Lentisphaerae bacterium RIFOXYA12_64_32]OGV88199.1 MAG: energy-dependent translational throttle protein EttA [Lentisphaerae bacterium RIFOXYB12_FULL_65_16]
MPPHFIFTMRDVCKAYDGKTVLEGINLSFYYGAKIGIVGENGAGKSSLLRIMAGVDTEFHGDAQLTRGMRVGFVPQEPRLTPGRTVRECLAEAMAPMHALINRYDEITGKLGDDMPQANKDRLMNEMSEVQEQIEASDGWEIDRLLDIAANALVLPPDDTLVDVLSGGERRRVALCKVLLERPDLLLLDEPTNHLDAETVAWLEAALRDYHGTVIIATHDRYFLDNITKWILELENGRGIPYEGNYSSWLEQKLEVLRRVEKSESQRQKVLSREMEWIRSSPKGQIKKSRARIERYEELASQRFEVRKDDVSIQIPPGPRLGDKVLVTKGLCKGYGDLVLLKDCSFSLPRGAIVGVVGPNGTGKTTLFRMIVGEEKPDAGALDLGSTVVLSYVDQNRDTLHDENTVFTEITGGEDELPLGDRTVNSRAYVARFNFRGPQQQKPVSQLSGGERNRVHLAKLLRRGGNLILLDEPTNDLDVNTMRVLEEALIDFPGCALVISHDRFFLDRICTHLLLFDGGGRVRWFEGNFKAYEEQVLGVGGDGSADGERLLQRRNRYKRLSLR